MQLKTQWEKASVTAVLTVVHVNKYVDNPISFCLFLSFSLFHRWPNDVFLHRTVSHGTPHEAELGIKVVLLMHPSCLHVCSWDVVPNNHHVSFVTLYRIAGINCWLVEIQEPSVLLQRDTVLWGEVVGCIVLGLSPCCQITIQLTVFPEVTVMSSFKSCTTSEGHPHRCFWGFTRLPVIVATEGYKSLHPQRFWVKIKQRNRCLQFLNTKCCVYYETRQESTT